jgi:uncharacterized membrane protein
MTVWSVAAFATVRPRYQDFWLARFDLGNMVQAVWSTAHGHPLEVTDVTGQQMMRLGGHVDPILALLAPFWLIAPSPLTLAAVQIAACALGALPVFWLARKYMNSENVATLMAVAYLAYPWLAWTALDAVHPVTFATPLFLYAIWFLDQRRLARFSLCAVLICACGELMGLPLAALGLWYWLSRKRRLAGLVIVAAGVSWSLVALELVVPALRHGPNAFYAYYGSVGGSPRGILETAATDPAAILSKLFSSQHVSYIFWLGAPLLGIFVFAPGLAMVALPQLLLNGLSDWPFTTDPRYHYLAAIIPFLVASSVLGLAKLPETSRRRGALLILASCIFLTTTVGTWRTHLEPSFSGRHVQALREALALVPDDAPVSTTNRIGSHVSGRRYVYSVPVVGRSQWIVIDEGDPWVAGTASAALTSTLSRNPRLLRGFVTQLTDSRQWLRVFQRDAVFVFKRASGT